MPFFDLSYMDQILVGKFLAITRSDLQNDSEPKHSRPLRAGHPKSPRTLIRNPGTVKTYNCTTNATVFLNLI